jgi:hypothetical protein
LLLKSQNKEEEESICSKEEEFLQNEIPKFTLF